METIDKVRPSPPDRAEWDIHRIFHSIDSTLRILRGEFEHRNSLKSVSSPSVEKKNSHQYLAPVNSDSRCPCPALNTLANHEYLPRDGRNITIQMLLDALQHRDTYHLSPVLAEFLVRGSIFLMGDAFPDPNCISLEDLSLHGYIEHDASIVHKNTPEGCKFAPLKTDICLLEDFLQKRPVITLEDIAARRAALERVSRLGYIASEIARGEWALVLDVFGRAHSGGIPSGDLRVWLYENKFPDGWKPDHEQCLFETEKTAKRIWDAMRDFRSHGKCDDNDAKLEFLLKAVCVRGRDCHGE